VTWDGHREIESDLMAISVGQVCGVQSGLPDVAARPVRRVFEGRHDQVASARDFVRHRLGAVPVVDEAVLLVSELCTNALLHTASGEGGTFEVTIYLGPRSVRVEVRDDGSGQAPVARAAEALSEDGRGLSLVELIAERWGYDSDNQQGRSVYFELRWKEAG
jgi:anti-sigma regulatory factor (Ser/Thr protein kinase)